MNPLAAREISSDPMVLTCPSKNPIFQILLRLPVKSLLRFKCVSKSFCSMISSTRFIKAHLKISSEDKKLNYHRVLMLPEQKPRVVSTYSLHAAPNGNSNQVRLDFPLVPENRQLSYVDSINGLVCLHLESANQLILWNPSIRKFKALPIPSARFISTCGFGYVESSDDYKLVVFDGYYPENSRVYKIVTTVYSLKTNSSQKITTSDYSTGVLSRNCKAKYYSGSVHCLCESTQTHTRNSYNIASFDLTAGTFGTIPMPDIGSTDMNWTFTKFGEYLAVFYDHFTHTDVYIMKDYAEKQWTKLISISKHNPYFPKLPVFFFENGLILCCCYRRLELYNGREFVVQKNLTVGLEERPITYVESLISPDNGSDIALSNQ